MALETRDSQPCIWLRIGPFLFIVMALTLFAEKPVHAQADAKPPEDPTKLTLNLYGFAMLDMGYQFNQNDPAWFDVVRPTKLPAFEDQFGGDERTYAGVRQTRFGVKSDIPTAQGLIRTIFEFELFGVGDDAGQTTFRLRHAYGELGQFGAGQTWSPFMDIDVFPNSIEYWGPSGMAFFRNVQLRWMPIKGETRLTFALERPGAAADIDGPFAQRIELQNITPRFPYPDISGEFRLGRPWGYVEIAALARYMSWDDNVADAIDLSGSETGWGVNLSSNINMGKTVLRLQALYGEGIENYMNDAPADVGVRVDPGAPAGLIDGEALPVFGGVAFLDVNWNDRMSSTIGYSIVDIDNSNGQAASAFATGEYALVNMLFYPTKGVMLGPEIQWGRRENARDGFSSDDVRVQFSAKYNFGYAFGGQ